MATQVSTTTTAPGSVSSQRLLHDAFATLSLTDKCALSISLSQLTPKTPATASAGHKSAERINGIVPSSGSKGPPPQPLSLLPQQPPPPPLSSSSTSMAAAINGFDGGPRSSSDDHSSAASLSNHHDYAVMTALQELDTSYVDMLMADDQSTTSSLPSTSATTMLAPFPDTYSTYAHSMTGDGSGGPGFAPGERSPSSSVSSAQAVGIPRATSGSSSVLGFSVSSSSVSSSLATNGNALVPPSSNLSSSLLHKHNTILANGTSANGGSGGGSGGMKSAASSKRATEDLSDIQSVISESDKVSLDKAMSLMGQQELIQVEEEVRKIQNNVRGWLLRKNYVNLREAARSLQVAWREKRSRSNSAPPPPLPMATGHSPRMNGGGSGGIAAAAVSTTSSSTSGSVGHHSRSHSISLHGTQQGPSSGSSGNPAIRSHHLAASPSTSGMHLAVSHPSSLPPPLPSSSSSTPQASRRDGHSRLQDSAMDADDDDISGGHHHHHHHGAEDYDTPHGDIDRSDIEEKAAATLQAATRRMIARRSFANLHKHTMASLTIQRNLVRWWTRHSRSSSNAEPMDPNYVMTVEPSHVYVPTYFNMSSSSSTTSSSSAAAVVTTTNAVPSSHPHGAVPNHSFPFPYR